MKRSKKNAKDTRDVRYNIIERLINAKKYRRMTAVGVQLVSGISK